MYAPQLFSASKGPGDGAMRRGLDETVWQSASVRPRPDCPIHDNAAAAVARDIARPRIPLIRLGHGIRLEVDLDRAQVAWMHRHRVRRRRLVTVDDRRDAPKAST